jgi:hypothetical protein
MPENIISILIWGILGLIAIYLIFQRIKEKKKEDFEDRDN